MLRLLSDCTRRVANRESARRVRQKRQETMEEMQARMDAMQRQTAALTARLQEVEGHKAMLVAQLNSMRDKWSLAVSENLRLADEAGHSPSRNVPHEVCICLSSLVAQLPCCLLRHNTCNYMQQGTWHSLLAVADSCCSMSCASCADVSACSSLQTSSGRSTATEIDMGIPSASCAPVSPPTAAQPASYWPPAPAYGAYAPISAGAAAAGAVTSGQPNNLRIPSVTSSTQISGFRPGVTITSAVPYPKTGNSPRQQHPQPHNMAPPPPFTASAAPMLAPVSAPPAMSMAPAAGSMYPQGGCRHRPPASV